MSVLSRKEVERIFGWVQRSSSVNIRNSVSSLMYLHICIHSGMRLGDTGGNSLQMLSSVEKVAENREELENWGIEYDEMKMIKIFFSDLLIPRPTINWQNLVR